MWNLTREQRKVICAVILLLLVGWAVKAWRSAHSSSDERGRAGSVNAHARSQF